MRYQTVLKIVILMAGLLTSVSCQRRDVERGEGYRPEIEGLAIRPLPMIELSVVRERPLTSFWNFGVSGKSEPAVESKKEEASEPEAKTEETKTKENLKQPASAGGG